jgi:hypothetical protein
VDAAWPALKRLGPAPDASQSNLSLQEVRGTGAAPARLCQGVPDEIKRRQIVLFAKCDPTFGAGVGKALERELCGN